jgi:alkylhydroperoxidase family enzyme
MRPGGFLALPRGRPPEEVFEEARRQFDDAELANLTLAVVAINDWNRLSITFRTVRGTYRAAAAQAPPES